MRSLLFATLLSSLFNIRAMAQYTLEIDSNQLYVDITDPLFEAPDTTVYFENILYTKPGITMKCFEKVHNLSSAFVYMPLKEGYCYFDNGSRSVTLYACKGDYVARPGTGETSVFSIATDDTPGNRKFIMQWENMGFEGGSAQDYINFQALLYEATGVIEFRYGASNVSPGLYPNGKNGPTVGLLEMDASFTTIYNQLWLDKDPPSPALVKFNGLVNLSATPKYGMVYRFVPSSTVSTVGMKNDEPVTGPVVYPNPAQNEINIAPPGNQAYEVFIYNATGQGVRHTRHKPGHSVADLSLLPPGFYSVLIKEEGGRCRVEKIMKQ